VRLKGMGGDAIQAPARYEYRAGALVIKGNVNPNSNCCEGPLLHRSWSGGNWKFYRTTNLSVPFRGVP
jgi:hypothetical protein